MRVAGAVYKISEATKAGEEGPGSREGTRKIPSQFAGGVVGFQLIFYNLLPPMITSPILLFILFDMRVWIKHWLLAHGKCTPSALGRKQRSRCLNSDCITTCALFINNKRFSRAQSSS